MGGMAGSRWPCACAAALAAVTRAGGCRLNGVAVAGNCGLGLNVSASLAQVSNVDTPPAAGALTWTKSCQATSSGAFMA